MLNHDQFSLILKNTCLQQFLFRLGYNFVLNSRLYFFSVRLIVNVKDKSIQNQQFEWNSNACSITTDIQ